MIYIEHGFDCHLALLLIPSPLKSQNVVFHFSAHILRKSIQYTSHNRINGL